MLISAEMPPEGGRSGVSVIIRKSLRGLNNKTRSLHGQPSPVALRNCSYVRAPVSFASHRHPAVLIGGGKEIVTIGVRVFSVWGTSRSKEMRETFNIFLEFRNYLAIDFWNPSTHLVN